VAGSLPVTYEPAPGRTAAPTPSQRPVAPPHPRRASARSHRRTHAEPAPRVPQRVSRRLGPDLIGRIVGEYAAGASTTALARRYGFGKGTLLRLISESGVTVRRRGPRRG
jgi:hypothetical protein